MKWDVLLVIRNIIEASDKVLGKADEVMYTFFYEMLEDGQY